APSAQDASHDASRSNDAIAEDATAAHDASHDDAPIGDAGPEVRDAASGDADARSDAGPWACGNITCGAASYCLHHLPAASPIDAAPIPEGWNCVTLPTTCTAAPTCDCVKNAGFGFGFPCVPEGCHTTADGHLVLDCSGV